MILLGFEIIKVKGLVGFNIFLRVWLILVEIGNNKVWRFGRVQYFFEGLVDFG
jgi:hypothetical protein